MSKKARKGDPAIKTLALKGLSYPLEAAAKKYCKEFCDPGQKWFDLFDVATRQEAAKLWLPDIIEESNRVWKH